MMLIDGDHIPNGTVMRRDVVVIGAGPAGITVAQQLAASGIHVTLVEAGGRHHDRSDNDAFRGVSAGEPFPLVTSRQRGFGGTSGHWTPETGLRLRPFDDLDFHDLPGRPGSAWPFGRSTLEPYYQRAHALLGVDYDYDPRRWFDAGPPDVTWDGGPGVAMFRFAPYDSFVRRFETVTTSPRIDMMLNTSISSMELGVDADQVALANAVSSHWNRFQIEARIFILAAGGIDNARVLLSSPGRTGNGIGNETDNVGRYFHDHISIDCGELRDASGQVFDVSQFEESGAVGEEKHQAMLWLGEQAIREHGLLNAAFWLFETDSTYSSAGVRAARSLRAAMRSRPMKHVPQRVLETVAGAPDLARFATRRVLHRTSGRVVAMRIMAEQIPHRDSRIQLLPQTDARGMRRVSLDWKIDHADFEFIRRHRDRLVKQLETRGFVSAGEFEPESRRSPVMSNYHHMGSTRMHVDPALGVVNADSQVHSAHNLFVAGSSVFPAGGYLNPTLTIIAMAIRIADAVSSRLAASSVVTSNIPSRFVDPSPSAES